MPSVMKLAEMSQVDISGIDRSTLVDIKKIKIDTSLPIVKRMLQYLKQIKNPYCFLCGATPVKVRFTDSGKTLDDAIKDHYLGLKTFE